MLKPRARPVLEPLAELRGDGRDPQPAPPLGVQVGGGEGGPRALDEVGGPVEEARRIPHRPGQMAGRLGRRPLAALVALDRARLEAGRRGELVCGPAADHPQDRQRLAPGPRLRHH
ncbi:MAG TPA: hypothetical protein VHB47_09525 [Thermoanaerobaculia bacterium]|nr:hypothetical protein [Thermoanaerobaculia bacterium]